MLSAVLILRTALHLSTLFGARDAISVLLELNADPTLRDASGRTPLFIAAEQGKTELMALLLEKDPSTMNIPNSEFWTPLHVSAWGMQSVTCFQNRVTTSEQICFPYCSTFLGFCHYGWAMTSYSKCQIKMN